MTRRVRWRSGWESADPAESWVAEGQTQKALIGGIMLYTVPGNCPMKLMVGHGSCTTVHAIS